MEMLVGKAVCAMCMDANTEEGITREDQRRFASLRGEGHDEGNVRKEAAQRGSDVGWLMSD